MSEFTLISLEIITDSINDEENDQITKSIQKIDGITQVLHINSSNRITAKGKWVSSKIDERVIQIRNIPKIKAVKIVDEQREIGRAITESVNVSDKVTASISTRENNTLFNNLLNLLQSENVIEFNKIWEINGRPALDFSGRNFSGLKLDKINLPRFILQNCNLTKCDMEEVNLQGANLKGASMDHAYLRGADLRNADLTEVSAKDINLMRVNMDDANLSHILLDSAHIDSATAAGANFHQASMIRSTLIGSVLDHSSLELADLSHADLSRCSLKNSNLMDSKLESTKLLEANISGAYNLPISLDEAKARGAITEGHPSVKPTSGDSKEDNAVRKDRSSRQGEKLKPPKRTVPHKYNYESVELYPDNPTDEDSLSRSALSELLAHRMNKVRQQNSSGSFLINLDGSWGSGKSSFLMLLKKELNKRNDSNKKNEVNKRNDSNKNSAEWLVVEFNAWQNQRIQNPWWSLMDSVQRQAAAHLVKRNFPRYIKTSVYQALWRLKLSRGRLFAFTTFILFLLGIMFLLGDVDFSNLAKITEAGKQLIEYIQKISGIIAVTGSLISGILLLRNMLLPARTDAAQLLQSFEDPMKRLSDHFKKYIDKVGVPVVVFIDDLDRCNEKYTVDFLEGLQTIFRDAHVIYIVAADKRWIHFAYEKTYASFLGVGEPARPLGQLFLAKIFQMSVPIPKISPELRKSFFNALLEGTKTKDKRNKAEEQEVQNTQGEKVQERIINQIQSEIKSYDNRELIEYSMQEKGEKAQAAIKAVLRTLEEPERESETEKNLQKFAHLLEPNPRAIKRLLNTFVIYRAIVVMKRVNLDFDKLTLWTIITMRWPLLGDHLSAHPEDIQKLDTPIELPAEINKLLELDKPQILDVIRGKKIGKHLDAKSIEKLAEAY